jgi:hypothetical protein
MFDAERAIRVGLALVVVYEVFFLLGINLIESRIGTLSFGILGIHVTFIKLFLAGLIPLTSLVATVALARKVLHGSGAFAGDVYTVGAAMLPIGLAIRAAGIVGPANFEVIAVLFGFALSYTILMLYSGCTHIAGIPEASVAPAVPAMVMISIWLTKVIVVAIL